MTEVDRDSASFAGAPGFGTGYRDARERVFFEAIQQAYEVARASGLRVGVRANLYDAKGDVVHSLIIGNDTVKALLKE